MKGYSRIVDVLIRQRHHHYRTGRYPSHKIQTPVLATGSLTLGGAGKTPLTHYLARLFHENGISVCILSRGYGRESKGILEVHRTEHTDQEARRCGDEPVMLKTLLPSVPVIVSEDRVAGAQYIEKHHKPQVILLDDGFQHRKLKHDMDILIFKKEFKGARASYFPFGDLRDSLSRLVEADLIFLEEGVSRNVIEFLSSQTAVIPYQLTYSLDKPVNNTHKTCAFCGIARPDRFKETLRIMNIHPQTVISFRDHVKYSPARIKKLKKSGCSHFITTLKDSVKLPRTFMEQNRISVIKMDIVPKKSVEQQLLNRFR